MARNSIKVILDEETIASVAKVAAINGTGFDETLESLVNSALAVPKKPKPASKPAAKKTATKSRK